MDEQIKYEIYRAFVINLKHTLKPQVKGEVKIHINEDTLYVRIFGANNIVFYHTQIIEHSEIVQGLSSAKVTEVIVKKYKRYITNLFFNETFC